MCIQHTCSYCIIIYPAEILIVGSTNPSTKQRESGMSIVSLMTWWPRLSRVREALCGPVRTMMETYNLTLLHKVCEFVCLCVFVPGSG